MVGTKKPKLSIAVVNYKQDNELFTLVKSLKSKLKTNYEILVFDNSQSLKKHDDYKLFNLGKNVGYGAAVNYLSIKAAGTYFMVLNPDVKVIDNLDIALEQYKNLNLKFAIYSLGKSEKLYNLPLFTKFTKIKKFSGFAFLTTTTFFKTIGGFDINYFMYFEDDDLCRRLTPFKLSVFLPQTTFVKHTKTYTNESFKKRKLHYYKSLKVYLKTYYPVLFYIYSPLIYLLQKYYAQV